MAHGNTKPDGRGLGQRSRVECVLGDGPLTLDVFERLWDAPLDVHLTESAWQRVAASAARCARIAQGEKPAYGINTGFGKLCRKRIPPGDLDALQRNLIVSHAVGVGGTAPDAIVRLMMLLKVFSLTHGVSGISRNTLECLVALLNADALPLIPLQGSLGASGDLAPLAHMVLPMISEGHLRYRGQTLPAAEGLAAAGVSPITLGAKEGLALINGTQFMGAHAIAAVVRARRLVKQADVIATMSLDGMAGSVQPFDERLHALRPHPGAITVAENVRRLMAGSEILESHKNCDRVQDPYSLRCMPQVHGASRDALAHACDVIETEINSVTDNPLILDDDTVISGGLFHGQPLALVLDYLAIALAELASISERRTFLLLSGVAGLPELLVRDAGVNSGLMIPQYTSAALVSENKGLCMPASVDSIPTSLGQEDHVSMGARAGVKCLTVLDNTETVLAIEQLCAAQALDLRNPLGAGVGVRAAHDAVRTVIDHVDADRLYGEDIQRSLSLLRSGEVLAAVAKAVGAMK